MNDLWVARLFLAFLISLIIFVPIIKGKSGYFNKDIHLYATQNDYP